MLDGPGAAIKQRTVKPGGLPGADELADRAALPGATHAHDHAIGDRAPREVLPAGGTAGGVPTTDELGGKVECAADRAWGEPKEAVEHAVHSWGGCGHENPLRQLSRPADGRPASSPF